MIQRFGAYEILYELKSGGMGAVLLGRRRGPGAFEQLVAIKTILAEHAQTPMVRAMFLDEAAILARLAHPAIATVHDFGEDGGTLYMVMEYVAGIAFRDVMDHQLPPVVAARAIAEACRGLHAAHELRDLAGNVLGVVHRDISPDNLMFGFDGHIKVIDFGIALMKGRQAPVTEFGTVKGKPPYMSPEQVKNEAIDRRSDVFSLGVVLWELLAGRALFEGDSIYAIARAVEHQEIKPPSLVLGAPLPLGLDAAVMNALDRDVSRRTPTAAALAEQLEEVIQSAGEETLEAWAERALAERRAAHRAWLAGVVAGKDAPRPIGRPTGAVTALAPAIGKAPTLLAPAAPAALPASDPTTDPPPDPQASTHLAAVTADELRPPRRSLALPIVLGLVVLALVGGWIYRMGGASEPPRRDAGIIALPADAAGDGMAPPREADAGLPIEIPVEIPVDAAVDAGIPVPLDAGRRRPVRIAADAGHAIALDAAAAPAASTPDAVLRGTGLLIAKHTGDTYLGVMIDGSFFDHTPVIKEPIPAGTHTIELVDMASHRVVVRRTVTVHPGETVTITP
ncbi:MAG TPA: serine/threonine-protein kinase [Kofleriaceae bacterium]|nr:serine/threonine-protein kinase [Kofleriaceae bacterium]